MKTYTEEQVIAILDYIERNGFNDNCLTMNDELDRLNNIGVVKNCSIPDVPGRSEQLFCHHEGKYTLRRDGNCCKCHLPPDPKAK